MGMVHEHSTDAPPIRIDKNQLNHLLKAVDTLNTLALCPAHHVANFFINLARSTYGVQTCINTLHQQHPELDLTSTDLLHPTSNTTMRQCAIANAVLTGRPGVGDHQ